MKLNINIQPYTIQLTTGLYGSIGHKRGSNNHIVDFESGNNREYHLNGSRLPIHRCPESILSNITDMAIKLDWYVDTDQAEDDLNYSCLEDTLDHLLTN